LNQAEIDILVSQKREDSCNVSLVLRDTFGVFLT